MNLINQVVKVCQDLKAKGWADYLLSVSDLNIDLTDPGQLADELQRELKRIDRLKPGIGDFAAEGVRAIEGGNPARSFLYHMLASPGIGPPHVKGFPTPDDIEVIENYVYGVRPPSIAELRERADGNRLALVVFAAEYRVGSETVHQKHADMCYSRTGVARIGTEEALYLPSARGYTSTGSSKTKVRTIPCRYSTYIAVRMQGDPASFGPLRAREEGSVDIGGKPVLPDAMRFFWVPVHKVFSGEGCIRGLNLHLRMQAHHHNEKLRRLHLYLQQAGLPGLKCGRIHCGSLLNEFPFTIDGLRLTEATTLPGGSLLVTPRWRTKLVEEAYFERKRVLFPVPTGGAAKGGVFRVPSGLAGGRPAPEFVYVRRKVDAHGTVHDLTKLDDVLAFVNRGGYDAQIYIDHTGDGWVHASCPELMLDIPEELSAYSILSPPDLYPAVKQQDVMDWWKQSAPPDVRETLFPDIQGSIPPEPLSDARITANITFRRKITDVQSEPVFDSHDDTYTAIVSAPKAGGDGLTRLEVFNDERVSPLPDGASGLFAPGWDISRDLHEDEKSPGSVLHLAGYGSSSPFLEDARLCAAQSAFWPAVAPDTTRLYEPGRYPSVTPIPDRLLGWDGLAGPRIIRAPKGVIPGIVEMHGLDYTDYIARVLGRGLDYAKIGSVVVREYKLWTLLMCRMYQTVNASSTQQKTAWSVVEFDEADDNHPELLQAKEALEVDLSNTYRFFMIRTTGVRHERNPRLVHVEYRRFVLAFVTPERSLYCDSLNGVWRLRVF